MWLSVVAVWCAASSGAGHLKAIRKRLAAKSPHVQFLSLSLLDVAVKNAGDAFHETVSAPDFLSSLSSLATTTKYPHVRDQALSLIQTWAKAFPSQGLHSFAEAYTRLRNRGVAFPDDKSAGVVFTPPVNLTVVAQRNASPGGRGAPDRSPGRSPNRSPGRSPKEEKESGSAPGERNPLSWASPQYVSKVKAESVQVLEYLSLFQDLIASTAPPSAIRGNESIQSLHSTLLDCRNRVSHLLVELEEETLMDLMIHLSEAIRITLDYYNARLKGEDVQPPVIEVPAVLKQGGPTKTEAKEGKEQSERASRAQLQPQPQPPAAVTATSAASASRAEKKLHSPQPQSHAAAASISAPAAATNPLSEFDPLA